MKSFIVSLAVVAFVAFPALAQHDHSSQGQAAPAQPSAPPAQPATPPAQQGMQHRPMHGNMPARMKERMQGQHGRAAVPSDPVSQAFAAANAKMHRDMAIRFSGNADVDFVRGMIPHHQGAVDMAEIVLKFGQDAEVKKLATDIIAAQKAEIAQMQTWLQNNTAGAPGLRAQTVIEALEAINAAMHKEMVIAFSGKADADFVRGMIPHHEGAVDIAKVLLRYGTDEELRKLGEDVIRSQSVEIVMMLGWLRRTGG